MNFTPRNFAGSFSPFWRGECAVLPGGYAPVNEIPERAVLRRGTPVEISDDLTCVIAKSALVLDGGSDTEKRVAKGLLFVAGDEVTDGTDTAQITAIDRSEADYDTLTLDSALSGSYVYVDCRPNAVVCADYENTGLGTTTIDVGYQCLLLHKALAAPVVDAWRDGIHLAGNPCVMLIVQ